MEMENDNTSIFIEMVNSFYFFFFFPLFLFLQKEWFVSEPKVVGAKLSFLLFFCTTRET